MKRIIKIVFTVAMILILACSTKLLITTHNTVLYVPIIYSLGILIVLQLGLLKAWFKRAILDNDMPISAEQFYHEMAEELETRRLLNTDLGASSMDEYREMKTAEQSLEHYYSNKLHPRSVNKQQAWDKVLAMIKPDQTN